MLTQYYSWQKLLKIHEILKHKRNVIFIWYQLIHYRKKTKNNEYRYYRYYRLYNCRKSSETKSEKAEKAKSRSNEYAFNFFIILIFHH